ncbi:MAG: HAMP domain-containing histidine kinase [Oscillospiraceae bacterium]|nr:HAMP domain-containing histidine kinase [Oscillospiraceae bacterium]
MRAGAKAERAAKHQKRQRREARRSGGRTNSIARRIAWSLQWKKLWAILWQTLVMGAAAVVVWCAALEVGTLGHLATSYRYFELGSVSLGVTIGGEAVYDDPSESPWATQPFWTCVKAQLQGEDMFSDLVVYYFGDQDVGIDGESWDESLNHGVSMGGFVFWLCFALTAETLLRLAIWLLSAPDATRRIRKYLRPIDDIAQVTESISASGFDVSKFQSLEEAIDHLNGTSPDERLHIGDDDLAGLETAVNNLLARMRTGYRQQVRFVDDASHELRTPIAVIQGYADMLDRWGKTDPQVLEESIAAIKTETERMKRLVEQLLFLARGDSGRQELTMKELDLAALAGEVWKEYQMIDPAHEYALKGEGPLPVSGDEAMLKQAVRILTDNAAKYSPAGSPITISAFRDGEGRPCVQVQDNGVGIAPEDVPRIFDRFFRADAARTNATGGSGLGLSIAKWIVAKHGGHFQVTSYEGIGTRIKIVLRK